MENNYIIAKLKGITGIMEENCMKQLNNKQKKYIKDRYKLDINFKYLEDEGYIFMLNKADYKLLEKSYFNKVKEYIETFISIKGTILIAVSYKYEDIERLFNKLNSLE